MNWARFLSLRAAESFFRYQATAHASEVVRGRLPWPLGALLVLIIMLTNPGALLLAVYGPTLGTGVCLLAVLWTSFSLLAVGLAAESVTLHLPYACSIAHWVSYRLAKKGFTIAVSIAAGVFQGLLLMALVTHAVQVIGGGSGFVAYLLGGLSLTIGLLLLWGLREPLRIVAYAAVLLVLLLVLLALDKHTLENAHRLWAEFTPIFRQDMESHAKWLVGFLIVFGLPCSLGFDSRLLQVATSVRRSRLGYCFLLAGGSFLVAAPVLVLWLHDRPSAWPGVTTFASACLVLLVSAIALSLHALAATWTLLRFGSEDGFNVLDRIARGEDEALKEEVAGILRNVGGNAFGATVIGALVAYAVSCVHTLLHTDKFADQLLLLTAVIALSFGPPLCLSLWRRALIKRWISSLVLCLVALALLVLGAAAYGEHRYWFYFVAAGLPLFFLAWVVLPPYTLQSRWNPPLPEVEGPD